MVFRDDLLEDRRLWGHLYWYYLEARAGDGFADGLMYFLGLSSQAANDWLDELAASPAGEGCYPEVAITVPLKNGSRVGAVLSCYPEDFEIHYVQISPALGRTRLHLRWQELLAIAESVEPRASVERTILLLCLSAELTQEEVRSQARPVLRDCWLNSGLDIRHLDEFLNRLSERYFDG